MKKITILSLHLNHGGIQKYVSNVANLLSEKFNVKIVCVYKMCEPVYQINKKVKIEYLLKDDVPNKKEFKAAILNKNIILILKEGIKAVKILYKRNSSIKKYLKKEETDIIISTRILFTQYLKLCKKSIVKVAQEHRHHNNDEKYINKLGRTLKYADYFMGASNELTEFYKKRFNNEVKYKFIPMPIEETSQGISKLDKKNIITVGRFSKEKGLDDLIDIFAEVNKVEPKWKLHLVGNGSEYNNILNKIKELNLEKNIILHGFCDKDKVYSLYKDSSIYVMTSHEESFGLVLIEASMHSLPLVAFDSAQGACEIIVNNKNGYLISNRDKSEMVKRILELINDDKLRKEIGNSALNESRKYEFNNLREEYIKFFEGVLDNMKNKRVMFISSVGGHLTQLLELKELFKNYNYTLITEYTDVTKSMKDKYNIEYLPYGSRNQKLLYPFILLWSCIKSFYYFIKYNPDVIITTGANTAAAMCCLGKLFGKKVIYIESFAKRTSPTITGKCIYKLHAYTTFVVQWESMLEFYPDAEYWGWIY